ncbi:hypothetical protein V1358_03395 [Pseudoalteromonas sp. YIC-656]
MVKKNSSTTLLTKTPVRKRSAQTRPSASSQQNKNNMASDHAADTAENTTAQNTKSASSKLIFYAIIIAIIAFIFTPKPQLLTYQKLGMVTSSVYLPPILGGPSLVDSSLVVQSEPEDNSLYLCHDLGQTNTCQKYQIVKREGVFAVIVHLFSD